MKNIIENAQCSICGFIGRADNKISMRPYMCLDCAEELQEAINLIYKMQESFPEYAGVFETIRIIKKEGFKLMLD
jgi:hypothetical protein